MNRTEMTQAREKRFVWTKIQAAAGEPVASILRRKELERQAGNGVFWWGIGESKGAAIKRLLAVQPTVDVLFSLMLSAPASHDSNPDAVAVWQTSLAADGREQPLPEHVIVTSGAHTRNGDRKHSYYALVCQTSTPLPRTGGGALNARNLKNLGGEAVGSSQVTAVVKRIRGANGSTPYAIDARATLATPGFANLAKPRLLSNRERRLLAEVGQDGRTVDDWWDVVRLVRRHG